MKYRSDIDGLRAASVSLVVLYHMRLVSGGFVGVDVFFVISGYLITGIIFEDIEGGRFSLLSFYARRMKRILPALLVMIAAVMLAGYALLLPGDYIAAAWSAVHAAGSVGNLWFLEHSGYFDPASGTMPLLHTWSLGVEEQFYLVWPVALVFLAKVAKGSRAAVGAATVLIAVVGLTWCISVTGEFPKRAFFGADTRAWELAVGATVAMTQRAAWPKSPLVTNVMSVAGICLVVWSAVALTDRSVFPGAVALFPCVGAALLLAPRQIERDFVSRALSLKPIVFLGLISYSVYLWHWPILVLFRHYNLGEDASSIQSAALLAVILVVSWASWRFVEEPVRRSRLSRLAAIGTGIGGAAAIVAGSIAIVIAAGFPARLPEAILGMQSRTQMWEWTSAGTYSQFPEFPKPYLTFGAPWQSASKRAFLWGDSHAAHIAPIFDPIAREHGVSVLLYHECPAVIDNRHVKEAYPGAPLSYALGCGRSYDAAIRFLQSADVDFVILAASWSQVTGMLYDDSGSQSVEKQNQLLRDGLAELVRAVSRSRRNVAILGDVPQWGYDPVPCVIAQRATRILRRTCIDDKDTLSSKFAMDNARFEHKVLTSLGHEFPNLIVVPPYIQMCAGAKCVTTLDDEFLYRDASHIRRNLKERTKLDLAHLIGIDGLFDPRAATADLAK